ncbi:MAG TPA: biotin transporter BioY [Alphaproteobacteria bacterium]|nr:biotin transporter BioY [Alphaproteobacteria bacterium]
MLAKYITAPQSVFSAKFLVLFCLSLGLLILSSKIQVPMFPVPITFQTAIILLIPALCGLNMGLSVLGSYFALGAIGLPVFAMAAGAVPGPAYFIGPTGGYLAGFVIAMFFVAALIQKMPSRNFFLLSLLFLAAHLVILFFGWGWLSYGLPHIGAEKAFIGGVVPFITGSILKSFFVAAIVKGVK